MSRFLTPTDLRVLRGQFRKGRQLFEVLADVVYESDILDGCVTVPKGYVTDLASVPKLPLTWFLAGGTGAEAAVIHDWLYMTHAANGKAIKRSTADAVFSEAIKASGDTAAPAGLMWLAVRVGGFLAWGDEGPEQPTAVADIAASAMEAP
jgi:hypothetical protein